MATLGLYEDITDLLDTPVVEHEVPCPEEYDFSLHGIEPHLIIDNLVYH